MSQFYLTLNEVLANGEMTARVVAKTKDPALVPAAIAQVEKLWRVSADPKVFIDMTEVRAGRPGKAVYIISKDEDCTVPVEEGMIVPSAAELATIFGVTAPMVGTYLKRAKEKNEIEATIRGVHFCYLDDWAGSRID